MHKSLSGGTGWERIKGLWETAGLGCWGGDSEKTIGEEAGSVTIEAQYRRVHREKLRLGNM